MPDNMVGLEKAQITKNDYYIMGEQSQIDGVE